MKSQKMQVLTADPEVRPTVLWLFVVAGQPGLMVCGCAMLKTCFISLFTVCNNTSQLPILLPAVQNGESCATER